VRKRIIFIGCLLASIFMSGCLFTEVDHALFAKHYIDQSKNYDMGITEARNAIAMNPSYAPRWYWLGVAQFYKKQYDEAIPAFKKVIDLRQTGPQLQSSYDFLGWAYFYKGDYAEAIMNFNRSLELEPRDQESLRGRGWSYFNTGKNEEAVRDFNRALEYIKSDNTLSLQDALRGRGKAYSLNRNHDEAIRDFNRLLEINPKEGDALNWKGWTQYRKGNFNEAVGDFNRATEHIPQDNKSLLFDNIRGKAFSYLGLGDSETAINLINKAKEIFNYDARYDLSAMYYAIGDKEKAWEYRGGMGMVGVDTRDYNKGGVIGVEVVGTFSGGPAERAGILKGDVIVKLNDMDITDDMDFF